jgi:tetratricopeptide (TPR) repeat protein
VSELLEQAERAVEVVGADPREGTTLARAVLRDPSAPEEARAVAERALGLANRDLGRPRQAIAHLEASVRHARAAGSVTREVETRSTLASAWLQAGDPRRALREADLAASVPGADHTRPLMSRALILQRLGRDSEALVDYERALRGARRHGDTWTESRLLSNRGVLHAYHGDFRAAEQDLERAREIHLEAGSAVAAAEVLHNLGFVLARRGDTPGALAYYDEAGREFERLGFLRHESLVDRCEALLALRLLPEARRAAETAVSFCEEAGRATDAAEARLMLARACLLEGDVATAQEAATAAGAAFTEQRRVNWALFARFVALQATAAAGAPSAEVERDARSLAPKLARHHWPVQALESVVMAARAAIDGGRLGAARVALAGAPAAGRRAPASVRVRTWYAEALLRLAQGDRRGALVAIRAGLRIADDYRATLGATELRVRAGAVDADLAELGTSIALESGGVADAFAWAERWHSRALEPVTARPPQDDGVVQLLGQLRETVSRIGSGALEGDDTSALVRRQSTLESEIRRRSHTTRRGLTGGRRPPAGVGTVRARLGPGRCLVELVTRRGELAAFVVTERQAALVALGPLPEVERERSAMLFALGRIARRRGAIATLHAAVASLDHARHRLDALLFAQLAAQIGDRELVLVPVGELHALAWSLLPSVRGRALTVAPSATAWLQREESPEPARRATALVAGPGVDGAGAEVEDVRAAFYPAAEVIGGDDATCERVGHALESADLVHVAAHGEFRADNPLFSSLVLADGPLTVYDMEGLRGAPDCLVLSACDAGLAIAPQGGEPIGPMAALLGIGTRSLVASVTPVPDAGAAEFMLAFHGRLATGAGTAAALAGAQAAVIDGALVAERVESGDTGVLAAVAAAGYVCFGSG